MELLLNSTVSNFLKSHLTSDALFTQSLLFHGESNLGKFTTAKAFAKGFLCEKRIFGGCDQCQSCLAVNNSWHPDFKLVELESDSIKDEDLKFLFDYLIYKPQISQKKVLIVNNSERLSSKTRSSLLKTLEEPNPNTLIILITDHPKKLLKTVRSRLIPLRFIKSSDLEIEKYVLDNFKISKTDLKLYTKLCNNKIGKIIEIINDKNILEVKKKNIKIFNSLLTSSFNDNVNTIKNIIDALKLKEKEEEYSLKKNFLKPIVNDWLDFIELTLQSEIKGSQNQINDLIKNNLEKLSLQKKSKILKNTIQLLYYIDNFNSNQKLLLETYCLTTLS